MDVLKEVLLATDGSERAQVALQLATAVRWPVGTTIEVLDVNEPVMSGAEVPPDAYGEMERQQKLQIDEDLALARSRLVAKVPQVTTATRRGRAASEIVDEAARIGADLVLIGSRGRGPLATMLLGSVAAEVVDRAPCPVLVARGPRLARLVVADDGSASSALAVDVATTWPIFKGLPTRVVSVAPVRVMSGVGSVRHEDATQRHAEGVDALRTLHGVIAGDTANELRESGVPAEPENRFGDPADQIIMAALEHEADLIVMGSRGQSGLERVLLGSVARNVLTHAPVSVLIVRRGI
jgi:nucleotide-binding universal stress UspA family protein